MKFIDLGGGHVGAFHNLPISSPDVPGGEGGGETRLGITSRGVT